MAITVLLEPVHWRRTIRQMPFMRFSSDTQRSAAMLSSLVTQQFLLWSDHLYNGSCDCSAFVPNSHITSTQ